jgi:hypothetical protein
MLGPIEYPGMAIVTAMITPAILILATGSLVASTLVRLGRVVDQTRALIVRAETLRQNGNVPAVAIIEDRMGRQLRRAELARNALWGYYLAIVFFLISSVMIALSRIIHVRLSWIGPAFVLLGGCVLIAATSQLVVEVGLGAGSLREEVESYKRRELS